MSRLVPPVVAAGRIREMEQPTLRAGYELVLRPWQPDDATGLLAAYGEPDISYWHMRRLEDEDEARSWVLGWRDRWNRETDAGWAIESAIDKELVGQVALRGINLEFGCGEITYWVLAAFRRAGVATTAVEEVTRWALELGLHRLVIQHSVANGGSCRVAEKAGFEPVGTMPSALLHADGWHDMHIHARIGTNADLQS